MFFDFKSAYRQWNSKWIWDNSDVGNTWMNFRKTVLIDKIPESVKANIAAESRYWLYINGKNVVFEGSLKRGINLEDGYYDEVEIAPYLKKGENTIAVLVWYWGIRNGNMSCNMAGKPGFMFEIDTDDIKLISDETWKAAQNRAYLPDDGTIPEIKEPQPNGRLPEFNVYYDGRLDMGEWYMPDYDDSAWSNAVVIGEYPDAPWNKLLKRPIPLLKDFGLKDYINSKDYEGYTTAKEEVLDLYLEYNAQLTPYLEIETDTEGLKIDMRSDNYADPAGNGFTTKCAYVTRKGKQTFEGLSWFPGEHVYYTVPAGITIKALKFRESGYNTEFAGYFRCDDEFLNKLWIQSERTLYITMRDNFMDCPDRERAQWWGDVTNEMMMFMYCLDKNAYALYEKGLYTKMGYIDSTNDGTLRTLVPTYQNMCELPIQELAGIGGMWEYYLYTGNADAIKDVYPYVRKYLYKWWPLDNGFIDRRTGTWDWPDWGRFADIRPLENAWYYRALNCAIKMARLAGHEEDIEKLEKRKNSIYKAYNKFWTERGYMSCEQDDPDDRCNAVAVIAGLADESKYPVILDLLKHTCNSSPYMEKYVLDAMCQIGCMKDVQARIKTRYKDMVEGELAYSTLWEFWDRTRGTKNHAWTGGPLITMSRFMAGIAPTTPGYDTYRVEPRMGELKHIEALVPSVKGNIKLQADKTCCGFAMQLDSPADTVATVSVPCCGFAENANICVNGVMLIENGSVAAQLDGVTFKQINGERFELEVQPGSWQLKAEKHL